MFNNTIFGWLVLVCLTYQREERDMKKRAGGAASLLLAGLLGEEHGVDVGQDTTLGDGDTGKELAELLIVADSQLDVAGHDAGLLVVAGSVSGQLKNLGGQVLEDSGEVHGGTGTDALCRRRKGERKNKGELKMFSRISRPLLPHTFTTAHCNNTALLSSSCSLA